MVTLRYVRLLLLGSFQGSLTHLVRLMSLTQPNSLFPYQPGLKFPTDPKIVDSYTPFP